MIKFVASWIWVASGAAFALTKEVIETLTYIVTEKKKTSTLRR